MTYRRIIIGDVHGHYDALIALLDKVALNYDDQVYFLGDLIDRGPKSAQVVDFVYQNHYKCLLGNHEQMLLDAIGDGQISSNYLQAWLYSGGYTTLVSYNNNIPQDHIAWLKTLPLYFDLGDVWLVHAGIHPNIPLDEQSSEQFCWVRDEFHSINEPYFADKLIITGHTITFTFPGVKPGQLVAGAGWLDIDTGAYHQNSGWLTALDFTNKLVYQIHVKKSEFRMLPLEEAVTTIEPAQVLSKRSKKIVR